MTRYIFEMGFENYLRAGKSSNQLWTILWLIYSFILFWNKSIFDHKNSDRTYLYSQYNILFVKNNIIFLNLISLFSKDIEIRGYISVELYKLDLTITYKNKILKRVSLCIDKKLFFQSDKRGFWDAKSAYFF